MSYENPCKLCERMESEFSVSLADSESAGNMPSNICGSCILTALRLHFSDEPLEALCVELPLSQRPTRAEREDAYIEDRLRLRAELTSATPQSPIQEGR